MTEDNGIFTIVIDNTIDEIIYNDAYVQVNNIKYQIKPESLIGLTFYTESSNSLIKIIKTTYLRNKERIEKSKKTTDKDVYYFNLAEKYLYQEFQVILGLTYDETKEFVIKSVSNSLSK